MQVSDSCRNSRESNIYPLPTEKHWPQKPKRQVPDAKHAVDIVPNPTLEGGMIAALPLGHGTALETIDLPELVI